MLCDLCGERTAKFKMNVEFSELNVCENCRTKNARPLPLQSKFQRNKKDKQEEELIPNVGKLVHRVRKEREFGRGELAHKLGIKESVLTRIEAGKLEPDESLRKKLEKELRVKLTEFPEFKPSAPKSTRKKTLGDIVELR